MSAPRLRTSSAFSPLAVVATVALRCLASSITVDPRPPGASVDEDLLAGRHVGAVDEGLPSSQ
jgi:hypothetical protein